MALLVVSLLVGSVFLFKKNDQTAKLTSRVPTLSFSVEPQSVRPEQNFDLVLRVNPNSASFYAFELYTVYDPTKVEFQNTVDLSRNIKSSYPLIRSIIDRSNNTITVVGTRLGNPFSGSGEIEIARVKMRVKKRAKGDMIFSWSSNSKLGSNIATEKLNSTFHIK